MPYPGLDGQPMTGIRIARTLASSTDSGKNSMIATALILACVINGETLSKDLEQATRLTVAVIILIIVRTLAVILLRQARSGGWQT